VVFSGNGIASAVAEGAKKKGGVGECQNRPTWLEFHQPRSRRDANGFAHETSDCRLGCARESSILQRAVVRTTNMRCTAELFFLGMHNSFLGTTYYLASAGAFFCAPVKKKDSF
jgi:hypothetical protein